MSFSIPEPFSYNDSFDVGVDSINEQHKRLFDLINNVDSNRSDAAAVKELLDYVVFHFKHEEDAFDRFNFADKVSHKKTHDDFVAQASAVKEINDDVIAFVKSWLVNHIMGSDMQYGETLRGMK